MGAQRAISDSAEPEPLKADHARPEPLCQLVTEDGDHRPDTGPAIELSEEAIRQRSKQIWEREGCPEGCAQDHWVRARAELAALMEKTSNAHRPNDDIAQSIVVPAMAPQTSQSTQAAAAPDSKGDVLSDDVETAPKALSKQHVTFSPTRDESVCVSPRPLRLPLMKRSKQTSVAPSIICAGIVLSGTVESPGEVQFDGDMEGDICCAGLAVGEEALVQGEVMADEVTVRGHIRGRIRARKVHLFCGSCVEGEILYGTLMVETGAKLDCSFQHLEDPLAQELAPEKTDVFTTRDALSSATTEAAATTCGPDVSQDHGAAGALSQERPLSQSAA